MSLPNKGTELFSSETSEIVSSECAGNKIFCCDASTQSYCILSWPLKTEGVSASAAYGVQLCPFSCTVVQVLGDLFPLLALSQHAIAVDTYKISCNHDNFIFSVYLRVTITESMVGRLSADQLIEHISNLQSFTSLSGFFVKCTLSMDEQCY